MNRYFIPIGLALALLAFSSCSSPMTDGLTTPGTDPDEIDFHGTVAGNPKPTTQLQYVSGNLHVDELFPTEDNMTAQPSKHPCIDAAKPVDMIFATLDGKRITREILPNTNFKVSIPKGSYRVGFGQGDCLWSLHNTPGATLSSLYAWLDDSGIPMDYGHIYPAFFRSFAPEHTRSLPNEFDGDYNHDGFVDLFQGLINQNIEECDFQYANIWKRKILDLSSKNKYLVRFMMTDPVESVDSESIGIFNLRGERIRSILTSLEISQNNPRVVLVNYELTQEAKDKIAEKIAEAIASGETSPKAKFNLRIKEGAVRCQPGTNSALNVGFWITMSQP